MLPTLLAGIAFALHTATALVMFRLSGAPGWRRVRVFGFVALTGAIYSGVDFFSGVGGHTEQLVSWVLRINLSVAALHSASWLAFTFSDERGSWRGLPRWVKRYVGWSVATIVPLAMFGPVIDTTRRFVLELPEIGVTVRGVASSALGTALSIVILLGLVITYVEQIRRWRRGVEGAGALVAGFTIFLLCGFEEFLVASGVIRFIFLADVAFLAAIFPVGLQILTRFRQDAARLHDLSERLSHQVGERTAERDVARGALVEQERLAALGRIAAGVGHEVNNPLAYLALSLDELKELIGRTATPDVQRALANANDGVRRIRDVVQGLRSYARQDGTLTAGLDLRTVARDAARVATVELRRVIRFETSYDEPPLIDGDASRLVQVVVNLLANGAQAAERTRELRPSTLRLSTRRTKEGWAELEVADSGPGFDAAILDRIGEPYVTTRANEGGTGLGLFVSWSIIDAHGGRMVIGVAPEGGALIAIQFPPVVGDVDTATTPDAPDSGPRALKKDRDRLRVLVIDDEPLILRGLVRGLGRFDLDVVGCEQVYDAIVTDLMMPVMGGIEFAAWLAEAHPELRRRLVVITGGATSAEAEAFVSRDDVRVLVKPIQVKELAATIRTLTG
ncbi:MAG: response regulator [Gemmatimonadaceae bacterium]|nr:response regulator [Gemmatimonadaceae bacterium]